MRYTTKEGLKNFKPSYLKKHINADSYSKFLNALSDYYCIINNNRNKDEEFLKNETNNFLHNTFYKDCRINTHGRIDSAIIKNNRTLAILEFKRPNNTNEMISVNNINKKALHEAIFYYIGERINNANFDLKKIIVTDTFNWFIFDSQDFERIFFKDLSKFYKSFVNGQMPISRNDDFFTQIIAPYFSNKENLLDYIYFNLDEILQSNKVTELKQIYKILHPDFLLKEYNPNDTNVLNKNFYNELLYLMGLKEITEKSKTIIVRDLEVKNTFLDVVYNKIKNETDVEEQYREELALELVITWINRVLFIKLFESQLIAFNNNDKSFEILNYDKINSFSKLNALFIQILNKKVENRDIDYSSYSYIPYLNSSLFELTQEEKRYFAISSIENNKLALKHHSSLRNWAKYKDYVPSLLEYFLDFLKSYDFTTHIEDNLSLENKDIISASVLGLIFEKINGYKDGAVYTPSIITQYMAKKGIEKIFIQKFNDTYNQKCENLEDVKFIIQTEFRSIEKRKEVSNLINNLKICDISVGSGHFLVSILNQLLALKHQLGCIFKYNSNNLLTEYDIVVDEDVLTLLDGEDKPFVYDKKNKLSQEIQQTLFNEKRIIIENCLFGVDINSKSVHICRLRLWIELLKNAYYKPDGTMETLPNIDINIKCGNSLISKIPFEVGKNKLANIFDDDITDWIKNYKKAVKSYKQTPDKEFKRKINVAINEIKLQIAGRFNKQLSLNFGDIEKSARISKRKRDNFDNAVYKNSMEWAIEFPEILDDNGKFLGFDLIIGNPPYIDSEEMVKSQANVREFCSKKYKYTKGNWDIYIAFFEQGYNLLQPKGYLTYITPDKWLVKPFGNELRINLIDNITELIFCGRKIFDVAKVDAIITFLAKSHYKNISSYKFETYNVENLNKIDKKSLKTPYYLDFLSSKQIDIIFKIEEQKSTIKDFAECKNACTTSDTYTLKPLIINNDSENYNKDEYFKIINTGTIDKYSNKWGYKEMKYLGDNYKFPIINKSDFFNIFNNGYSKRVKIPKLIIKGMTLLDVSFDITGNIIPAKSTCLIDSWDLDLLKFICGILNSKLPIFYLKEKYPAQSYNGGINFTPEMINNLPFPKIMDKSLINIVDNILNIVKEKTYYSDINKQNEVKELQKQINSIVYNIYNLTPEEIQIIEGVG